MSNLFKFRLLPRRIGIFFCLIILLSDCTPDQEEFIFPERKTITEAVYASATILPLDYYTVYPEVAGIVEKKWVNAGDEVQVGQKLFRVRNQSQDLRTANAGIVLQQAQDELAGNSRLLIDLRQQIALVQQELEQDSTDFQRQKSLWEKNIGSKQQLERAELKWNNTKIRLRSNKDALAQAKESLQKQVARAKNDLQISANNQAQFVVTSRLDGLIYETVIEEGETVGPNLALAKIGQRDSFLVDMQIDERDISRVTIGQTVILSLDSYPEEVFEAKVSKIYPSMDTRSQSFRVEALFSKRPARLFPNLTCEANIIVRSIENALVIPRSYLLSRDSVITEDERRISLKTGISDLEYIQVLDGLDEQTKIYPIQ